MRVRAYSHLLGDCGVSVFGSERPAAAHRRGFPRSLDGAPFLLPSEDSALRLSLEEWFEKEKIRPLVVGTFEDSALLEAFGQAGGRPFRNARGHRGRGAAPVPRPPRGPARLGPTALLRDHRERKLRNPAVIAISERARALFG